MTVATTRGGGRGGGGAYVNTHVYTDESVRRVASAAETHRKSVTSLLGDGTDRIASQAMFAGWA
jgi:hypothetical protein